MELLDELNYFPYLHISSLEIQVFKYILLEELPLVLAPNFIIFAMNL
jgi:hypothetical protein